MVAQKVVSYFTRQQYLEWEDKQETKHEYHNGEIVAMAGTSRRHVRITVDVARALGNQLEDGRCEVFSNDMRVLVPECDKYYYPDVVAVCGEPEFEDTDFDNLLNPTLIIEVLSDSTERIDRREKRDCYRTLPSLQTYVLIAQDAPHIEALTPQADGSWRVDVANTLEATVELPSIGCRLRLADVYARVPFLSPRQTDTQQRAEDTSGNGMSAQNEPS